MPIGDVILQLKMCSQFLEEGLRWDFDQDDRYAVVKKLMVLTEACADVRGRLETMVDVMQKDNEELDRLNSELREAYMKLNVKLP